MFCNTLCRALSRLNLSANQQINVKFSENLYKSEKKCFSSERLLLSRTYTLIEEGKQFQEVPMIVQKIDKIENFCDEKSEDGDDKLEVKKVNFYLFIYSPKRKKKSDLIFIITINNPIILNIPDSEIFGLSIFYINFTFLFTFYIFITIYYFILLF